MVDVRESMPQGRALQINFEAVLTGANNFTDIANLTSTHLKNMREQGVARIGFVSGPVKDDDPEFTRKNLQILDKNAQDLREKENMPVFSSSEMFPGDLWNRLSEPKLPEAGRKHAFLELFRTILRSGYVTDLFMVPGWDKSEGATDEHKVAGLMGITIIELPPIQ